MLIRITWAAQDQVDELLRFYIVTKDRPEAAVRLRDDLREARRLILAAPESGSTHPRPYPDLARLRFQWINVRAYWISWSNDDPAGPVITNVLHVQADLQGRATPITGDVADW